MKQYDIGIDLGTTSIIIATEEPVSYTHLLFIYMEKVVMLKKLFITNRSLAIVM